MVTTARTTAATIPIPSAPSDVTSTECETSPVSGAGVKETAAMPV